MIALLNPKIIISIAVALMLGYGVYLFKRVDSLKQEIAIQTKINQDNAKELETVKANYTKTVKALENYIDEKRKIDIQIKAIKDGKPNKEDRAASNMLTNMVNSMRDYYKDSEGEIKYSK